MVRAARPEANQAEAACSLTAFSMPVAAFARSCAFMAGANVTLALKARKNGSAIAGIWEVSFISKKMNPPRSPFG